MRISKTAACLPLVILLSACGSSEQGHYDANGNYVPPLNPTPAQRIHAPDPGSAYDEYNDEYDVDKDYSNGHQRYETTVTTTYDKNGNRVTRDYVTENTYSIPARMMPPHGLCRVWFVNRRLEDQPRPETCEGIHQRAPQGTYIIYSK